MGNGRGYEVAFINPAIDYLSNRHSGGGRNPDRSWIPDQVRDDKGWPI